MTPSRDGRRRDAPPRPRRARRGSRRAPAGCRSGPGRRPCLAARPARGRGFQAGTSRPACAEPVRELPPHGDLDTDEVHAPGHEPPHLVEGTLHVGLVERHPDPRLDRLAEQGQDLASHDPVGVDALDRRVGEALRLDLARRRGDPARGAAPPPSPGRPSRPPRPGPAAAAPGRIRAGPSRTAASRRRCGCADPPPASGPRPRSQAGGPSGQAREPRTAGGSPVPGRPSSSSGRERPMRLPPIRRGRSAGQARRRRSMHGSCRESSQVLTIDRAAPRSPSGRRTGRCRTIGRGVAPPVYGRRVAPISPAGVRRAAAARAWRTRLTSNGLPSKASHPASSASRWTSGWTDAEQARSVVLAMS